MSCFFLPPQHSRLKKAGLPVRTCTCVCCTHGRAVWPNHPQRSGNICSLISRFIVASRRFYLPWFASKRRYINFKRRPVFSHRKLSRFMDCNASSWQRGKCWQEKWKLLPSQWYKKFGDVSETPRPVGVSAHLVPYNTRTLATDARSGLGCWVQHHMGLASLIPIHERVYTNAVLNMNSVVL